MTSGSEAMNITRTITGNVEQPRELRLINAVTLEPFDVGDWLREQIREFEAIITRKRGLIHPASRMGRQQRRRRRNSA